MILMSQLWLTALLHAQQLREPYISAARTAVTLPQINGVAAWGDVHGNSAAYFAAFEEYRQDIAVAGRDSTGTVVTKIFRATNNVLDEDFVPPSDDAQNASYSQNLTPALDGRSIAWRDYNKDGYPDLAIAGNLANGEGRVVLYKNQARAGADAAPYRELVQDEIATQQINNAHPGSQLLMWFDYDNDGDADLLTSGSVVINEEEVSVTRIFRNEGADGLNVSTNFQLDEAAGEVLPQLLSNVKAGDFDLDSDLDLLTTDFYGSTSVYQNNGDASFSIVAQPCRFGLIGLHSALPGKSAWVDLNGDDYLDLVIFGKISNQPVARYVLNIADGNGGRTFDVPMEIANPIGGVASTLHLEIGDMNNDGKSDIIVAGLDANNLPAFRIYRAVVTNGSLSIDVDANSSSYLPRANGAAAVDVGTLASNGGGWSSMSLGHFVNNTGATHASLDVLLLGTTNQQPFGQLLINNTNGDLDPAENTNVGSHAVTLLNDGTLRFEWAESAEQQAKANTQALRVRHTFAQPANGERYAISADSLGTQRMALPQAGNSTGANFWLWKHHGLFPGDRLYWESTTINARYTSASFHSTNTEGQGPYRLPYFAATGMVQQNSNALSSRSTAWADIDGDGDVDGVVGGGAGVKLWINLGGGVFAEPLVVPNFGAEARYEWGDVNGDGKMDLLVSQYNEQGVNLRAGIFRCLGGDNRGVTFSAYESLSLNFTCIDAKFADCDNDGDLDIGVLQGDWRRPLILFNDGPANPAAPLEAIDWRVTNGPDRLVTGTGGSISWADIDRDSLPDMLISGTRVDVILQFAEIYRNAGIVNGSVNFQLLNVNDLPQVEAAQPAWGDINNDGYLDLFIGGRDYSQQADNAFDEGSNAVLLNVADGVNGRSFSRANLDASAVLEKGSTTQSILVDLNNDGRLDLVACAGLRKSIYLNQMVDRVLTFVRFEPASSGSFGDANEPAAPALPGELPETSADGLATMDADGDGRMDLLIGTSGGGNTGYALYRNFMNINAMNPPAAPDSITQSYDALTDTLTLSWGAVAGARQYNLLVREVGADRADMPLQTGLQPGRWPLQGETFALRDFHPRLGSSYQIGVQSVNINRMVSSLGETTATFPAVLTGLVRYVAPGDARILPRLGTAEGLRVYADLDHDGLWDGEANEPSAVTDADGRYQIPLNVAGQFQVEIVGLSPNGVVLTHPAEVTVGEADGASEVEVEDYAVADAINLGVAVFYDRDQDGTRDANEELLPDWLLTMDANGNGVIDAGEGSLESGATFESIAGVIARLPQFLLQRDVLAPTPTGWTVHPAGGAPAETYDFPGGFPEVIVLNTAQQLNIPAGPGFQVQLELGVWHTGRTLYGHVIHDIDADGIWDTGSDLLLRNWPVLLDFDNDRVYDPDLGEIKILSEVNGSFIFYPVAPGRNYHVTVLEPDNWQQSFPALRSVPVQVREDNFVNLEFGFFRVGDVAAPANRAEALSDSNGDGVPLVFDYLFGAAVKGQPVSRAQFQSPAMLFSKAPNLPIRTDRNYPVFRFRVRPSHAGISYSVIASSTLDQDATKELAWREISSTQTTDGMIEREVVVLPALQPATISPPPADSQAEPPARVFLRLKVDVSGLPSGTGGGTTGGGTTGGGTTGGGTTGGGTTGGGTTGGNNPP